MSFAFARIRLRARNLPHQLNFCRKLLTLAIETSCDDTAVAIVEKNGPRAILHFNERITSNNAVFRGVNPVTALEGHEEKLANLIQKAIPHLPRTRGPSYANDVSFIENGSVVSRRRPDFISVTRGPGMRSNLSTGLATAKGLAVAWTIPIMNVHHMQAHSLTPRLANALRTTQDRTSTGPEFPFLSLLVSGGHTILVKSSSLTEHKIVVSSMDIAIGSCLDKCARLILPEELISTISHTSYGSLLENYAFATEDDAVKYDYTPPASRAAELVRKPSVYSWTMPSPLVGTRKLQFTFSGLASYVAKYIARGWDTQWQRVSLTPRTKPLEDEERRVLAREVMRACFEHLASRICVYLEDSGETFNTLVLSGGVAANQFLRHVMRETLDARGLEDMAIEAPPIELCTDNAAMIGWTGLEMFEAGYRGSLDVRALSIWGLENLLNPENEESGHTWAKRHGIEEPRDA